MFVNEIARKRNDIERIISLIIMLLLIKFILSNLEFITSAFLFEISDSVAAHLV